MATTTATRARATTSEGDRRSLRWRRARGLDPMKFRERMDSAEAVLVAELPGASGRVAIVKWGDRYVVRAWIRKAGELVDVGTGQLGEDSQLGFRSIDDAKAAATAAHAAGGDFASALRRNARRRSDVRRASQALEAISDMGARSCDDPDADSGDMGYDLARSLEAFVAEMARRGFVIQGDGSVREEWRARCRGRWLNFREVAEPEVGHDEPADLIRVEAGRSLEVILNGEWEVWVDGERVGAFDDVEEAKTYAVDRARRASTRSTSRAS